MAATPREVVYQTLEFQGPPRAPRHLWRLPGAVMFHHEAIERVLAEYPDDVVYAVGHQSEPSPTKGKEHKPGTFVDAWGIQYENKLPGVRGQVVQPLIQDWARDRSRVRFPHELLSLDREKISRDCAAEERFVLMPLVVSPFELLQRLRGPEELLVDLLDPEPEMLGFISRLHAFYSDYLQVWAETAIDALTFMDDWGSYQGLLVSPAIWREYFKPLYYDYVQIARSKGKKVFMHSDGEISSILDDLVELNLDALNCQIEVMGAERLAPYAGRLTFWGEVDRELLTPEGNVDQVREEVVEVHRNLWRNGGCFAQCEFGIGSQEENVRAVFEAWDELV
ncbi:MAG: uroporphyrinogen decarboxylase family protein [Fimbriimonadaceae bacterium]